MPGTSTISSTSVTSSSDDDAPLVSQMIAEDSQVIPDLELLPEGYDELARLYEDEIRESIDDAAEFELYTQTHSYAPSTIREFQRIWNNFERFLRSNPALCIFLDDDGHAVVPLQKLPCVLFIRGIAAVRRAAAVDGNFRYLGPGSINNAVAALKYHGFGNQSVPVEICRFFHHASKSQGRLVASETFNNRHPAPSQGLAWTVIKRILSYARIHDPDLHCFLVNLIQSLCRGERVSKEGWACFDWLEDHLTCSMHTSKCDQSGKQSYPKQFFFSEDVDLCLVTALGKKILTTPPEQAGPFVYMNNIKATLTGPVQTFERRLKSLLRAMVESEYTSEEEFGVPLDSITLHSLKRSAYRYLRNFPVPPSAIKARAEHRSGLEHTYAGRDEGPNPNDDATMGRVLAGSRHCTDHFYIVPPHFSHGTASTINYERIVPMYTSMQDATRQNTRMRFNKLLPHFMAAVLHHYHGSDQGLLSDDKLFQSPMWTTQLVYRTNLYNQLQGAGRSRSSISITGRNRDHDAFIMMRDVGDQNKAIMNAVQQLSKCRAPASNDDGSNDDEESSSADGQTLNDAEKPGEFIQPLPKMVGWGKVLQPVDDTCMKFARTTLSDLFSRYFVGSRNRPAMRLLNSSHIPRHWAGKKKSKERTLISKAKDVFAALLGQTDPACIDGNNACIVYEKLKSNVNDLYGEVITNGSLRTTYNKMHKNMDAYQRCCNAPPISLNPPRQTLLSFPVNTMDIIEDTILDIDDAEMVRQEEEVLSCFVCPYCDDDILYVYKTRKTLLEHVRTGHAGFQPPPSNMVKLIDSQKEGQSSNARWIRVRNAVGHIPKPAVVEIPSHGKPANLASTILEKGEVRSGSFVQVFNRSSKELWFALVVDGRIMGNDSDSPRLISARWCKPNSLELDQGRVADPIFLANIIAMGDHETLTKSFMPVSDTPAKKASPKAGRLQNYFSPVSNKGNQTACPIPGQLTGYFSPVCNKTILSGQDPVKKLLGNIRSETESLISRPRLSGHDPVKELLGNIRSERDSLISRLRHSANVSPLNITKETCVKHGGLSEPDIQNLSLSDTENLETNCPECKVDDELYNRHYYNSLCQAYPQRERSKTNLRVHWIKNCLKDPHELFQLNATTMKRLSNRGGGDCLFRALLQGLSGEVRPKIDHLQIRNHLQLRERIVDYAAEHLDPDAPTTFLRGSHSDSGPTPEPLEMELNQSIAPTNGEVMFRGKMTGFTNRSEYFAMMRQQTAWGEEFEIASAAILFRVCIHVYCPNRVGHEFEYFAPGYDDLQRSRIPSIYLININGISHYECLAESSEETIVTPKTVQKRIRNELMIQTPSTSRQDFVMIAGTHNEKVATHEQSLTWWLDALALCPGVTQDPTTFAWTHFCKDSSEKERQNGSLLPDSFQLLLRETVSQHHQKGDLQFLDLGSEAGMALWHFMLHPSIGTVTGIEIDAFMFDISVTLLSHISKCARQANVHAAEVILIKQDFLNSDPRVEKAMATADIAYINNVQFDKKTKGVPTAQQTVPPSHPFKTRVNTNLAAKMYALTQRDRLVLVLFEYAAFHCKEAKMVKSLTVHPTWGRGLLTSKTDVALLVYEKKKTIETPKRVRPQEMQITPKRLRSNRTVTCMI